MRKLRIITNPGLWLWICTIIFSYCILTIQLDWFWKIPYKGDPEKINSLLLNLSYSFIAATIFYLLTVVLPDYQRRIRIEPAINRLKIMIIDDYESSINCFSDLFQKIDYTRDKNMFISTISQRSLFDETPLSKLTGLNRGNYLSTLSSYHSRVRQTIAALLDYKDFLTSEEIITLEEIRNDTYPKLLSSMATPKLKEKMDKEDMRKAIGENLWKLYEKAKSTIPDATKSKNKPGL